MGLWFGRDCVPPTKPWLQLDSLLPGVQFFLNSNSHSRSGVVTASSVLSPAVWASILVLATLLTVPCALFLRWTLKLSLECLYRMLQMYLTVRTIALSFVFLKSNLDYFKEEEAGFLKASHKGFCAMAPATFLIIALDLTHGCLPLYALGSQSLYFGFVFCLGNIMTFMIPCRVLRF